MKKFKCINSGFTLIEITIGIMLSSIVSLTLYNMLNQSTKVVENVNSFTNLDNKIAILYNQMDKTISTAFSPRIEDVKSTLSTETVTLLRPSTPSGLAGYEGQAFKSKGSQKQQIEKLFYSENEGTNLKLLTFLSTGAVRGYDESGSNVTRVIYRLVKDEQNPGFYKLLIQQSSKFLDLEVLKPENSKIRSYELATGIKSLKVFYFAREEKQEGEKTITRTKLPDWGSKEMLEKYKQKLPEFVEMKGEIWDDMQKRSNEINFKFNIFGYVPPEIKSKENKNKTSETSTSSGQSSSGQGSYSISPGNPSSSGVPARASSSSSSGQIITQANNNNPSVNITRMPHGAQVENRRRTFEEIENLNLPNFWPQS